jgi:succinate dehydrogenase hydrophobic anchor subunit
MLFLPVSALALVPLYVLFLVVLLLIPRGQHHGLVFRIFKPFFFFLNNIILLDVSRCLRLAI